MHIKKLEICGFKSFVDRTVIHFDHDVTGVVGPNGCGKSNIVDAIRWCMGEQSPRQLRGRGMEDVIFAGAESRRPHGFAEVTITFSNTDAEYAATLPLEYRDYPEIAVTRRLFRDGTSEYLINKTQVRLKDLTDLFLGTGVGKGAYSIIEQGKIGLIVSAKPEDRRLLIEEAAGITKYKHRKKQAEKKMELTRQNLLRVGDIVAEVERNLSSLKRQASKAERYLAYRREHDDLILHEASHRLLAITVVEKVEREASALADEAVSRDRAQLGAREGTLEAARTEAFELEQRVDKDQNAAFLADNDVRTCEAETQRARDRMHHLGDKQRAASAEWEKVVQSADRLQQEQEAISQTLEQHETHESEQSERLQVEETKLRKLESELRNLDSRAGWLRKTMAESSAAAAAAQERLAGFDRRVDDMRLRRERLTIDTERFQEDLREARQRHDEHADLCGELQRAQSESAETVHALERDLQGLREAIVASERELEHAKNGLSQQRGRLRAVEELHARLEGVGTGTRALMNSKDSCVVGLVADLVEAPEDLIEPFAALLGEQLQGVVVNDLPRASALLRDLAGRKMGRATVVHASPAFVAGARRDLMAGPGIVGPLASLLQYAPEHEALARSLVADAVVVEDDDVVWRLRVQGVRGTLVTRAGTVFHADGRVSGGTGDAVAAGLLQQKRQMRELGEAVRGLEGTVGQLLERHGQLRERMNDTGRRLDEARVAEREAQLERVQLENDVKRADDQIATLTARLSEIAAEADELDGRLDETALERDQAEDKLTRSKQAAASAQAELDKAEEEVKTWAQQVAEQQEISTERKISFARLREQASSARATHDRLLRSIDELTSRGEQLRRETVEAAVEEGRLAASLFALRERMNSAVEAATAAHAEFDRRRQALDNVRTTLASHEAELKALRDLLDQNVDRKRKHDMQLQKLALEREHLLAGVAEKFRGLELARVVGDYHMRPPTDEQHRARIQELTELIDRMGPVNLDAMQEYQQTKERYEFYSTQKADLEKALTDLERAIQQMNRESRRLFRETFDSVNERFQVIFPRMFRGGRAMLVLTNPDDLLETGVDIQAQPPGKKVSSIELLSGGEKALTAVSLIFAIFQHRPSPFCVLDEVDAPLDEANVTRFNETVRTMTDRSQFILITHIKKTMQSVDVLYGVTMQEPGVSRLVSVKVNQAALPRWVAGQTEAVA